MTVKAIWDSPPQFVDANGDPYSGALLFFYAAGSSTKQNTYTDSTGNTACDNPITLNASGYPVVSGTIVAPWGTVGQTYKIGLAAPGSSDPPNSFIWTVDNISAINDTTVTIDQWVSGPAPTYISATSFSLVGDQTSAFAPGRRLKFTITAGTVYGTIYTSAYTTLTTITMVMDSSGNLDSGLSACYYGILSSDNPSIPSTAQQTLSSNTTVNLASARGRSCHVSGTTTITSFGNAPSGLEREVIFDGILTLTHNATSLILLGGANQTTAAGDTAVFVSEGGGNWRQISYASAKIPAYPTATIDSQTSAAGVGNGADATDDTLFTYTLPANILVRNGQSIRVKSYGSLAATANGKTVKCWFAGTALTPYSSSGNDMKWWLDFLVTRIDATHVSMGAAGVCTDGNGVPDCSANVVVSDLTANTSIIKVTGASAASAANDVVAYAMKTWLDG